MKKGFLFGLGVLIAGGVLAATISTVSIDTKTPGDTVTNQEFNSLTSGLGELTSTFNGTTADATSITIPKDITTSTKVSTPELCLAGNCQTTWPAGGGSGVTAKDCPAGQQLQSVTADGVFACGADQTGTGDNLGDYVVLQDLLPEMTGATPLGGNPPGSPSVVSTRNIGSATQWFSNLWVEDLHVGNQSLYMNGVKILESDPAVEMRFTADDGQKMSILTSGNGAEMSVKSDDDLNIQVAAAENQKSLNINNNSSNGTIEIATAVGATSSSKISINSNNILIGSQPFSKVGVNLSTGTTPAYTLDVNGDINFTGTLYENGVAFSGGGGGGTTVNTKTCTGTDKMSAFNATTGTFTCSPDAGGSTGDNLGDHVATENIIPQTARAYDLGSETMPFATLHATAICLDATHNSSCITSFERPPVTCPVGQAVKSIDNLGTATCAISTTPPKLISASSCNEAHVGETRVQGPMIGGPMYSFQVCMLHEGTWYWVTLLDSGEGVSPPGWDANTSPASTS